ncbi:MAG TPA: hypothetical protein VGN17_15140 [Bryobacteraceae bacterium]|jgi:hypothetical protein
MTLDDWGYAQTDPAQQLARLHSFSFMKSYEKGKVELIITVKEYFTPEDPAMPFFARADKLLNQRALPYEACGWGKTMLQALSACIREINRFPYQE